MKNIQYAHPVVVLLSLATLVGYSAFAGKEGHGSDSLTFSSGASEIMDKLECALPFDPAGHPAFAPIQTQLATLETKLPITGRYLESIYEGDGPLWCWVFEPLVEITDEGKSPIRISLNWKKKQLGINTGIFVLIHKPTFDQLPQPTPAGELPSQSITFNHEAMWSAVGSACAESIDGSSIRTLSNAVLHPGLAKKSAKTIATLFLSILKTKECAESRLAQSLNQDMDNQSISLVNDMPEEGKDYWGTYSPELAQARSSARDACKRGLEKLSPEKLRHSIAPEEISSSVIRRGPTYRFDERKSEGSRTQFMHITRQKVVANVTYRQRFEVMDCSQVECKRFGNDTFRCSSAPRYHVVPGEQFQSQENREETIKIERGAIVIDDGQLG